MKTERVTLLTSPDFKVFLATEARREKVSVAELVRTRCMQPAAADSDEAATLRALAAELKAATADARRSLKSGLAEAQAVLAELQARKAA
jgi:hypothetical protein